MLHDLQHINDYIKLGGRQDYCFVCAKKQSTEERRDFTSVANKLRGHKETQPLLFFKRHGEETCICMDCLKEIYEEHVIPAVNKQPNPIEISKEELDDLMKQMDNNGGK